MTSANYMQVLPGGHCLICHKDFTEECELHICHKRFMEDLSLALKITDCDERCKDSKYPMPEWAKTT